mgnify:CR=1 FL=1
MKKLYKAISVLNILLIFSQGTAYAQGSVNNLVTAYRQYKDVGMIGVAAPTVVEIPFESDFIERYNFAVLDQISNSFQPSLFKKEVLTNEIPISVSANVSGNARSMIDGNVTTYTEFYLPENSPGIVKIDLTGTKPITSSTLTVLLTNNVALPNSIEVRAKVGGMDRIVLASKRMDQSTVKFPVTTSNNWAITLTYGQPLRISELRLVQENATKTSSNSLRFLAQPNHSYRIYFDPDRQVNPPVGESGNLKNDKDVLKLGAAVSKSNPSYVIADSDGDGIPDVRDNCVETSNTDQKDVNNNSRGDICDDFDKDGIVNNLDNCPDNPNVNQADVDGDDIGNVCDAKESRLTEKYKWLPWVGIGSAALVLIALFALTARSGNAKVDDPNKSSF